MSPFVLMKEDHMRDQIEMPKGIFYGIIGICSLIILSISLEAIIKAKDTSVDDIQDVTAIFSSGHAKVY